MKRLIFTVTVLTLMSAPVVVGQGEKKILSFSSDYLPLKVGNKWVYQGTDPKEKIVVAVEKMEPFKRRTLLPTGVEKVETLESFILRITNGDRTLQEQWMIAEDGIYRIAAAGKEIKPPLKILKLPPAKGDSWNCESTSEATPLKGEIVVDQVTLPGFDGPVIQSKTRDFTVGDQKLESSYWFAKNVGIVKQHVKVGKYEMSSVLDAGESSVAPGVAPAKSALPELPKAPPKLDLK